MIYLCVQACLPGFYRVGGVLFGGNCLQCECNDHATECKADGVCLVSFNKSPGHQVMVVSLFSR